VTHPFHPWVGREFVFVAVRYTWGEDRVFFLDEEGAQRSLPRGWTDAALSAGRSWLRVVDLLELVGLVDSLAGGERGVVKEILP